MNKKKASAPDWYQQLSLFFSFCALIISGAIAFFTVFKVNDELRLAIAGDAYVLLDQASLRPAGKLVLTFINSGNRAVAVKDVYLNMIQPPLDQGKKSINCGSSAEVVVSAASSIGPILDANVAKQSKKIVDIESNLIDVAVT